MQNHIAPHRFYFSLIEFLVSAKQHMIAIGAEVGLTSVQAITLMLVDASHPRSMGSFCTVFHCDAGNMTGIIDALEERGLVSRQNDPNDRRIKVIRLEAAGKKLQQQITTRLSQDNGFMFNPLSKEEAKQFVSIVEKLALYNKPA